MRSTPFDSTSHIIATIRTTVIAIMAIVLSASGLGLRLDRFFYDMAVTHLNRFHPPDDILILAIDDITLDVMADEMDGLHWPYPRAFHARVLSHLAEAGAKAVFMDVILDIESGYGAEDDGVLCKSLSQIPTVLAAQYDGVTRCPPLPKFLEAGAKAGNAASPVDIDHLIRGMRGGSSLPGNFTEAIHYYSGGTLFRPASDTPSGVSGFSGIPTVEAVLFQFTHPGQAVPKPGLIHFHGPPGAFQTLSWFEVYSPDLFPAHRSKLKDKIVFIGKTISASLTPDQQPDIFPVPFGSELMAGIEIRANAYASLAHGRTRQVLRPLVFLLGFGLFVLCLNFPGRGHRVWVDFLNPLVAMILVMCGFVFLYLQNLVLPLSPFLFYVGFYLVHTLGMRYLEERDRRLLVQTQLFNYLPERVARHVMENPIGLAMAGDRAHITLLFADIAGFTTLSETFPPEVIVPILQGHPRDMTQVIFDNEGTLDKYLGDGIMAFWGAPEHQVNHADLALKAAMGMLAALDAANEIRSMKGIQPLQMRIGLHSGEAVVGNIGSELFIDYTAIGDNVNTASRIEGVGKYFDTRVTISGSCIESLQGVKPHGLFRLGTVAVKGRKEPIDLYTLSSEAMVRAFESFDLYLKAFDQGKTDEARDILKMILAEFPDFGPAGFHMEKFETDVQPLMTETGIFYWRLESK